jgi:transcriptional regulator with XRE-family HTH domain
MSQEDLARASGIDRATISQFERGLRSPRVATLEKLARGLGVEAGDLLPKTEPPLPFEGLVYGVPPGFEHEAYKGVGAGETMRMVRPVYGRVPFTHDELAMMGVRDALGEVERGAPAAEAFKRFKRRMRRMAAASEARAAGEATAGGA